MEITKLEFANPEVAGLKELSIVNPQDMDVSMLEYASSVADFLQNWVSGVKAEVNKRVLEGINIPGFKVVESRVSRKLVKGEELIEALALEGFEESLFYERKMATLTAIEKIAGKALVTRLNADGDYIITPRGVPTVAPTSDSRPVLKLSDDVSDLL